MNLGRRFILSCQLWKSILSLSLSLSLFYLSLSLFLFFSLSLSLSLSLSGPRLMADARGRVRLDKNIDILSGNCEKARLRAGEFTAISAQTMAGGGGRETDKVGQLSSA
jgi:hypothetical protein